MSSVGLNFSSLKSVLDNWIARGPYFNPVRLVHGRGGLFPGLSPLTLDAYGPLLVAILHTKIDAQAREHLLKILSEISPKGILQDRSSRPEVLHWSWGHLENVEIIVEHGLRYQIQPGARQNFGFFPDMVEARAWVQQQASGKKILNLFAFTCSFSVAAMAGGAQSVVNIDLSGTSLDIGRSNHRLNQQDLSKVHFLKLDVLKSWGRLARLGPYDLIICDPPTHQSDSFEVEKDYVKLLRRCPPMLKPRGIFMACLNSPHHSSSDLLSWLGSDSPLEFSHQMDIPKEFHNQDRDCALKILLFTHCVAKP